MVTQRRGGGFRWREGIRKNLLVIAGAKYCGGINGFVRWTRITRTEVEWNHKQELAGERRKSLSRLLFHRFLPSLSLATPFLSSPLSFLFVILFVFFLFFFLVVFVRSFIGSCSSFNDEETISSERSRGSSGFLANSESEISSVKSIHGPRLDRIPTDK